MSYNQKPPGASGSGMGGGPPNGPNNMPQVAKTFAGIQQQMQNLVHGQNAIPQSSQADINAFLQQQRIQNMLKQQQQFLQFQHQMQQQQQHQQQQHQHHNMASGAGVGGGSVGGPSVGGVTGPGSSGPGVSGEPLALTRTPGAAELLNKTYQQQANGNPTANPTFNQLQQTLQALPQNFVQQLQAFQYQMQAKQMQQQHGGGQAQHSHSQQQPVQGVAPPTPTTTGIPHQQQQQQKHQNQHQQQQAALSRYLTAAAAQAAVVSGNKMSAATPPTPPPLTNQMKPPNLPPNTQITPVTAANVGGGNLSAGPHPKMSTGIPTTVSPKHQAPPPSISLTPSKPTTSGPSAAHQQNKFTPPINTGGKGGHLGHSGHSQNLTKSTHGANTTSSNTISPPRTGPNADNSVAALKSPQSTPVQLTKQMSPTTTAAAVGNKTVVSATIITDATTMMVSPNKLTTSATTLTPSAANAANITTSTIANSVTTSSASVVHSTVATNASQTKSSAVKPAIDELAGTKLLLKSLNAEKEATKASLNDTNKTATDSSSEVVSSEPNNKKESEKIEKEKKSEALVVNKTLTSVQPSDVKERIEKTSINDLKSTSVATTLAASAQVESKISENKPDITLKSNKPESHDKDECEEKSPDVKNSVEKNKSSILEEISTAQVNAIAQETAKKPETPSDDKTPLDELSQVKNLNDEKISDSKELIDTGKKFKVIKLPKDEGENILSKDLSISEKEAEKTTTILERKLAPPSLQPIPVKVMEKDEANVKNLSETNNKKETLESVQCKIEEKEIISPAGNDIESTIAAVDSEQVKNVKDATSQDKEELVSLTEKAENLTSLKLTPINKINTEDSIKDSIESATKESAAFVETPVKKGGRQSKGAKSRAATSGTLESQGDKPAATNIRVKRKPKAADNSDVPESASVIPKRGDSDRKSKRHRLKTILYQSPLPELAYITKLSASEASNSPKPMSNEDRLIVFYKNEYMAVRNAEGTFYLCQTMQNVYRTSPRISIRWLSEDVKDNNVFIPDFYDHTDIECVLTTVELKRIDKGHLRLPKAERSRIENILKKAIDVEKGLVPRPELTEENPDGLDISLFKDESQIEKKALNETGENQASTTSGRKSRRGNTHVTLSARKSNPTASTPTSAGSKRKRGASSVASASSSSRKSKSKKRKTLTKRKKKTDNSDDDESSDDCESDIEYKPTQKRASLTISGASKTTPRAQRSPLAKARAASPITPSTSRSKNVPQKTTPTPSTSKASRGERAAKRKSITDAGSSEEASTSIKKPIIISNNKSKVSDKVSIKATTTALVKKSSSIINGSKTLDITTNINNSSTSTSATFTNSSSAMDNSQAVNNLRNGDVVAGISGIVLLEVANRKNK